MKELDRFDDYTAIPEGIYLIWSSTMDIVTVFSVHMYSTRLGYNKDTKGLNECAASERYTYTHYTHIYITRLICIIHAPRLTSIYAEDFQCDN